MYPSMIQGRDPPIDDIDPMVAYSNFAGLR